MRKIQRTSYKRMLVLAAVAVVGVGLAAVADQAMADETERPIGRPPASPSASPAVPAAIQPPAGLVKVAEYRVARGSQIYTCTAGAWVFKAPEAILVSNDRSWRTIHHFAGPSWQSDWDRSLVVAAKRAESRVAGAVPQLLLEVTSHTGKGELSLVSYIQRLNTKGGTAPTTSCKDGATAPIAYQATYVFWAPPKR